MRRVILLTRKQWLGLPLLVLLPILALCGTLGPREPAVVGRTALTYVVILAGIRVLGKRDLSQLTPFETILLFLIPQMYRNYLVGQDDSLATAMVATATLLMLVYVTSALAFVSPSLRELVASGPSALVGYRSTCAIRCALYRGPETLSGASAASSARISSALRDTAAAPTFSSRYR